MKRAAWSLAVLLSSCGQPDLVMHEEPIRFRMVVHRGRGDVLYYDSLKVLQRIDPRDSLIGSTTFTLDGIDHQVRAYTSDHYAPMDGGAVKIELDTIGVVYSRSTTWPGFSVVEAENDSLNSLITMTLASALKKYDIACWSGFVEEPKISTVDFSKTEIYDTTEAHP